MPLPTERQIRDAVQRALDRLTQEDAHLFSVNVCERCLTFRLALYLQSEFPDWRVDCEYNRDGRFPKQLSEVKRQRRLHDPTSRTEGDVYPDIIVHHRGPEGPNLLAIEAKRECDLTKKEIAFDYVKLRGYRDELAYQCVAFIIFGSDPHGPYCKPDFDL